jgi:hypothetical protein
MKNLIFILVSVLMFTACEEQEIVGGGNSTAPAESNPYTPPPAYTGEIVPSITSVTDLANTNLWNYAVVQSPASAVANNNGVSYTCPSDGGVVSIKSKFKSKGDLNDNGSVTFSMDADFSQNSNNRMFLWFDFSTNDSSSISINFRRIGNDLTYTVYKVVQGRDISESVVTDFTLSNISSSSHSVPIELSRTNSGAINITVDGNLTTLTDPEFAGDVSMNLTVINAGTIQLSNFNVTNSSYALYGGQ